MKMTEMDKWQRSLERAKNASEKEKQRRRDIQDLKNAGVWQSPEELYLNECGQIKPDAPRWFKNLSKAWDSNGSIHRANSNLQSQVVQHVKRKT